MGGGLAKVARDFGVEYHSLYQHSQNHISRQLASVMEKKGLIESNELLETITKIITRAEDIFKRNYEAKKDELALKALDSQRATIQLLSNISAQLHAAKIAELQLLKEKRGVTDEQLKLTYQKNLSILSMEELIVFERLQNKIIHQNTDKIINGNRVLVYNSDCR
jgi:transposase-like protein